METDGPLPLSSRFAGIMTTDELLRAGLSDHRIRRLVHRGVLQPVGRGAFARADLAAEAAGAADGQVLTVAAALAVVGPGAVASHHVAAAMHNLDLLRPRSAWVALTRPPGGGSRTGRPGVRVHAAGLPPQHLASWHGVPVTSAARTVVDLARVSTFRAGVVVADSALRGKQASRAELQAVLADCRHWRGIQRARQVVAFADARSESALESVSRVAFRDQGLPPPDLQVWVGSDDLVIGRADFLWIQHRTIAEADGAAKYANKGRAQAQLRRDAELRDAGFEVVHFGWDEIVRTPAHVAASVRAAFQRAART